MLGTPAFVEFARPGGRTLDATEVLGWLRDPELLPASARACSREDPTLLTASWQATRPSWSIEDIALLDELRYLLGDAPEHRTRRSTRSRT